MKSGKAKLLAAGAVLLVVVVWAWSLNRMNNWFSNWWFEYQVKRSVNPIELQQWATNLLAVHGHDVVEYQDFHGTNMPAGLKWVMAGRPPNVRIFVTNEVWVFANKGSPFLVVGAPSLGSPVGENLSPWKPGIYFVRPGK